MNNNELQMKLDRARWFVLQNSPFYGQLCMALTDKIGNPHGKTACTDGRRIFWDADFLEKMPDPEVRFVLLHETLHCAHGHLWRFPAGSMDHDTANQACDHAINLTLKASRLECAMPDGGLADNQFSGMAEEEIFLALQAEKQTAGGKPDPDGQPGQDGNQAGQDGQGDADGQPDGQSAGNGAGKPCKASQDDPCGSFTAPADVGQDEKAGSGQDDGAGKPDTLRDEWERRIIQAAQAAKATGQGDNPADLQRILDRLAVSPIDWRRETADFVKSAVSSRNDWTRSPRRHAWQSVIYPSRRQNDIGCIIGVRDTSGSIDDKLCAEFSAILAGACAELNCGLILIDCDAAIQAEIRIEPGADIPLTAAGGGGTDFAAPFARAAELIESGEQIAGLVYLTDLYGSGQPDAENIPTLWLCTNDQTGRTGRTVKIG